GRKHHIEAFRESPEEAHELEAKVLVIKEVKEGVRVREIVQAMLREEFQNRSVTGAQLAQFLLGETQHVEHFVLLTLVVVVESLLQVTSDANVIDNKTLVLADAAHPVHARDRLEQSVVDNDLVQVHNLFDRGVKAGEEHVVDNDNPHVALHAFFLGVKGQL